MYKKEFDNLLEQSTKTNVIPNGFFLYGESDFLIDYYGKKVKNLILKHNSSIDIFSFYFDEYNANKIIDIFSQPSLFCESILIIVKLDSAKAIRKKAKNNDFKEFLEVLKNTSNYLIVEFYDSLSVHTKDTKTLSSLFNTKAFINVRFFNPNQKEALEILQKISSSLNLNINIANLLYIYEIQHCDLGLCANEFKKFIIFDKEITRDIIDSLCYGLFAHNIDELCESLLSRGDYLKIISKIDEKGINDIDLIMSMQNYFYRLFLFFAHIKTNGRFNSIEVLGYKLPRELEEKYVRFATKLKEEQYLAIFKTLCQWRTRIIEGKEKNYLPNLIKIQAIIK